MLEAGYLLGEAVTGLANGPTCCGQLFGIWSCAICSRLSLQQHMISWEALLLPEVDSDCFLYEELLWRQAGVLTL